MSSIFQRIATLTKAALHEGLNKLEDPVLLTGQYLRDLDDKIGSAESKQRELKAAVSVLERRIAEYQVLTERSEADAVKAMSEGNELAARTAVLTKVRYTESTQESTVRLEETRHALAALEINLQSAKEEHARLKAKRAELAERARKAAEVTKHASQNSHTSYSGYPGQVINAGAASRGFERMEDKINEWEAQAEQSSQYSAKTSDPVFDSAVEAELERLRSRKTDTK